MQWTRALLSIALSVLSPLTTLQPNATNSSLPTASLSSSSSSSAPQWMHCEPQPRPSPQMAASSAASQEQEQGQPRVTAMWTGVEARPRVLHSAALVLARCADAVDAIRTCSTRQGGEQEEGNRRDECQVSAALVHCAMATPIGVLLALALQRSLDALLTAALNQTGAGGDGKGSGKDGGEKDVQARVDAWLPMACACASLLHSLVSSAEEQRQCTLGDDAGACGALQQLVVASDVMHSLQALLETVGAPLHPKAAVTLATLSKLTCALVIGCVACGCCVCCFWLLFLHLFRAPAQALA